jgi:hypothetical protein
MAWRQFARFPRMAVVPTHPARIFATARLREQARFVTLPGATARATVRTLRMQGERPRQRPVCPQEGEEQAVKGVRGFDDGRNEATLLAHGRDIAYRTDLVGKCDE